MSPEARSSTMSRIKSTNTGPERAVFAKLRERGAYHTRHARDLPGRPDIVFRKAKLAVFIDGDFWHGWRFPLWQHKLSDKWREKIAATRERDRRNFRKLRRLGWKVLRVWEHQVERSADECAERILSVRDDWMAKQASRRANGGAR